MILKPLVPATWVVAAICALAAPKEADSTEPAKATAKAARANRPIQSVATSAPVSEAKAAVQDKKAPKESDTIPSPAPTAVPEPKPEPAPVPASGPDAPAMPLAPAAEPATPPPSV